ncbi:MAG: hypothetical protein LBL45_13860 [Treponema sp.]|jgi:hypothetical protein|nr:hypothetical protein [Treponema sp.]
MAKKTMLVLAIAALTTGLVLAQEGRAKHTIVGGLNAGLLAFGVDVEYEWILVENFIGKGQFGAVVEAGFTTVLIFPILYEDARARWYPWSGAFFLDLGVGHGSFLGLVSALLVSGGIGWRIDIGAPDGWVFIPGISYNHFFSFGRYNGGKFSGMLPKISLKMGKTL